MRKSSLSMWGCILATSSFVSMVERKGGSLCQFPPISCSTETESRRDVNQNKQKGIPEHLQVWGQAYLGTTFHCKVELLTWLNPLIPIRMSKPITRVDVVFICTSAEHTSLAIPKHYSSKLSMWAWVGWGGGVGGSWRMANVVCQKIMHLFASCF